MASGPPVVVLGAGGHAKVVLETLNAAGRSAIAILDDTPSLWGRRVLGVPVTGPIENARNMPGHVLVIAIGDNSARRRVAERLPGAQWATVIHPTAVVGAGVELGGGVVLFAGVIVQPDVVIGQHAILNTACSVDHDSGIGEFAHVGPGVRVAGRVSIGSGCLLGVGSCVAPGVSIGKWSVVGAGAAVVRDIPDGVVAVGVPARPRRLTDAIGA